MSKFNMILISGILLTIVFAVLLFGNSVLLRINTDAYTKLSVLKTYNNITKKNKDFLRAYNALNGKPIRLTASAETVRTNISISKFKIKNVSINTDLVWDKGNAFFAESDVRLGVFILAGINLYGNENDIVVHVPRLSDEYIVFDKDKLLDDIFKKDAAKFAEIMDETNKLFSECLFSYVGRESKSFAGTEMNTHKIRAVLLKEDVALYLQRVNVINNLRDINVTEDIVIYLYTNKKHEMVAFELEKQESLPFDFEIRFALLGERWLLNEFAFDISIFNSKKIQVQTKGKIGLTNKDKIALTIDPINISTDYIKTEMELDARINAVLSESDTSEIAFPKNKLTKYEDLLGNKLDELISEMYNISSYFDIGS